MKATVMMLNLHLPVCRAETENRIGFAFSPPLDRSISLSDKLEVDLEQLDVEQDVKNLTTGKLVRLKIASQDVYDLNLRGRNPDRFPTLERRRGA